MKDSGQDKSMDCPIWGTDDISDEELLKEFEVVKRTTVPLPIPDPEPIEFERIWKQIQEERDMEVEKENVCKKRPGLLRRVLGFLKRGM